MLRTVVERLARGRAFKRRLPSSVGGAQLYVSPDSQLKYLKPGAAAFDLELLRIAREHITAESRVWDIGANVGVFTFAAAGIARRGHVLAVEADIWLAELLRRSASLSANRSLQLDVLPVALSDQVGVATFVVAKRGRASNYLEAAGGWSQTGGVRTRVKVPTFALDTLLEHFVAPTFLKIDVEGAESMVLKGGQRILAEIRPVIYIEVGSDSAESISSLLHAHRYSLYDGAVPVQTQSPRLRCTHNTLAIPN